MERDGRCEEVGCLAGERYGSEGVIGLRKKRRREARQA